MGRLIEKLNKGAKGGWGGPGVAFVSGFQRSGMRNMKTIKKKKP